MNELNTPQDASESSQCKGAFLPLVLVAISLALILIFQVSMQLPQRDLLRKFIQQNGKGVEQSLQVQASLQKLVTDLYAAAADDKDAQAIIAKYGIQMTGAPAPSATPAAK